MLANMDSRQYIVDHPLAPQKGICPRFVLERFYHYELLRVVSMEKDSTQISSA